MGYYTHYKIEIKPTKAGEVVALCDHDKPEGAKFCPECGKPANFLTIVDHIWQQIEAVEESDIFYALKSGEATKWYDREKDMRALSSQFPTVLFTLHGEGEDNDDIWTEYYLDGKIQLERAKIKIGRFDPKKLV
jgi:hypothetical protein